MPPARLSHAYATFVLRAKQFKSGRHQLEGSSIIGPASMIAWKIPNYNQWMDLLALPAVVASPVKISSLGSRLGTASMRLESSASRPSDVTSV
jgi:hypothetical protein